MGGGVAVDGEGAAGAAFTAGACFPGFTLALNGSCKLMAGSGCCRTCAPYHPVWLDLVDDIFCFVLALYFLETPDQDIELAGLVGAELEDGRLLSCIADQTCHGPRAG